MPDPEVAAGPADAADQASGDPIARLAGPDSGVRFGPAQVWGQIRVVPLLRDDPIVDLRLSPMLYDTDVAIVRTDPRIRYTSYVPHAFVADWTGDGSPVASFGAHLSDPHSQVSGRSGQGARASERPDPEKNPALRCISLRLQHRMARRIDTRRLRFLPLHMAMEGYLSLHFGGPTIAWEEWSRRAINRGLSPRNEAAYLGAQIPGLEDSLKIFELHSRQCGLLLYVGGALTSVMLTPHPEDYRALHTTLLNDLYGEVIYQYGMLSTVVAEPPVRLEEHAVRGLAGLRAEADRVIAETDEFHRSVAEIELSAGEAYDYRRIHRMGGYRLHRFLPSFRRTEPSHIGELITNAEGELAYLKTFRLSVGQVKRGYLLNLLAKHDWNLAAAGAAIGYGETEIALRLDASGFGYLLRPDILDRFRKQRAGGVG